jgi:hypothetical protein
MFGFTSFAAAPFADVGVSPNTSAYVSSVSASGTIGSVAIVQNVAVYLTGVSAIGIVRTVAIWIGINDNQTPSWQLIAGNSGTWDQVNDNQTPSWNLIRRDR